MNESMGDWPRGKCDRCGKADEFTGYTMSIFNKDWVCMDCKGDEREAPGYREACRLELAAVRTGHYNYRGAGLTPQDRTFLRERADARRPK